MVKLGYCIYVKWDSQLFFADHHVDTSLFRSTLRGPWVVARRCPNCCTTASQAFGQALSGRSSAAVFRLSNDGTRRVFDQCWDHDPSVVMAVGYKVMIQGWLWLPIILDTAFRHLVTCTIGCLPRKSSLFNRNHYFERGNNMFVLSVRVSGHWNYYWLPLLS